MVTTWGPCAIGNHRDCAVPDCPCPSADFHAGPHPEALKKKRLLTGQERIEARHWLQVLSEHARTVRNAMDPVNGMLAITAGLWADQWAELRKDLDEFTARVMDGKSPVGGVGDRNA